MMGKEDKPGITREQQGSATIVRLTGEVDLFHARDLKQRFSAILDEGTRALIVNLKDVSYIDSSGIGILLFLFSEARKHQASLFLSELCGDVMKVIELTKLQNYLPIVDSDTEAVRRLEQGTIGK